MGDLVSVTSAVSGVRFNVRLLQTGDHYGLNDVLVVGEGDSLRLEGPGPFVEFYDSRYPHTSFGQFVSRYGVSTILEGKTGLNLMGGVADWQIDGAAMDIVRQWLREETARFYAVGLPVGVTIYADGTVHFEVDLSEVSDIDEDDDAYERYGDEQVAADALTVSAAADRLRNTISTTVRPA